MRWQPHEARLAHATDFDGFRRAARGFLAQGVAPQDLAFGIDPRATVPIVPADPADLAEAPGTAGASPLRIGRSLLATLSLAIQHADAERFELMYRLLWRMRERPALQHDPLDADVARLAGMARAVRREQHKMKAFVRFRPIVEPGHDDPLHVAWFEPAHHVLAAVAPFFVGRFAGMRFSILTPGQSLHWDGAALHWAGGARRSDAPAPDAGEALWLAYYASIFNPARLKLAAMCREMPRRYWADLPEARLITPLTAQAATRTGRMQASPGTLPRRRIPLAARTADAPGPVVAASRSGAPATVPVDATARAALLRERQALAAHCRACPLGERATQTVVGIGPVDAGLMLVGEQPGDAEDLRGEPFVGPAGRLLDRACAAVGIDRAAVYLTNAVKHFKYELRGKRRLHKTPAQREAAACAGWLEEELALVRPRVVVALGLTAAHALLGGSESLSSLRGRRLARSDGTPVRVTWHPAALLRLPEEARAAAWADWLADLQAARDEARDGRDGPAVPT